MIRPNPEIRARKNPRVPEGRGGGRVGRIKTQILQKCNNLILSYVPHGLEATAPRPQSQYRRLDEETPRCVLLHPYISPSYARSGNQIDQTARTLINGRNRGKRLDHEGEVIRKS
jgi:hypothetical protein